MKNPEEHLRNAPRRAPSESLDRNMEAQFNEARQSARHSGGWLSAGVPAWVTAVACLLCLFVGRQLAAPTSSELVQAPLPVVEPAPEPKIEVPPEAEPEQPVVLVQVARSSSANRSSPFIRTESRRESRLPSSWTVTP
jgi:hypothetical protein